MAGVHFLAGRGALTQAPTGGVKDWWGPVAMTLPYPKQGTTPATPIEIVVYNIVRRNIFYPVGSLTFCK